MILAGFPLGTISVRTLEAKGFGVSTSFASVALVMFFWSAEAKTSAGAPSFIWSTRVDEPWKLKVTLMFGSLSLRTVSAISGNALFSEAAAKTLSSTGAAASVEADAEALADLSADALFPPEQAVSARRLAAATATIPL